MVVCAYTERLPDILIDFYSYRLGSASAVEFILKRIFLFSLCLLTVTACSGQQSADRLSGNSEPSSTEALTVMTWNLEWFYDEKQGDNYSKLAKEKSAPSRPAWDWRRDQVASSIAEAKPTILAVQEVENRRVLWYLSQALERNHKLDYQELCVQGRDHFTEQDVGMMIRPPVDVVSIFQGGYLKRMRSDGRHYDVTKHLMAVLEYQQGEISERVIVMTVHLRSRPEGEPLRLRQARLLHHWIADRILGGENVIVLGDFNTQESGETTRPQSDIGIASGLETPTREDDLVDLNLRLAAGERQTHLLDGRQFDRILCSRSLLRDDPSRVDLVFKKIEVRRDLAVRGRQDTPEQHWETYWTLPPGERDLSDHFPVVATFELR
jgi:endonuclease/exonuclease/phosphatase family metal-dependent hydrolase